MMKPENSSGASVAPTDDAVLIERARQGEESAIVALFEAHKRRIYALCLRMTHNPEDAEDLTQEIFVRVFRNINKFRGQSTFYTWLHRVAVNEVLMHLRQRRVVVLSLNQESRGQEKEQVSYERVCVSHDQRLNGTIDRVSLERAVAQLPKGYRTAFTLYHVHGYEHNEIAKIMNWSEGNSKSQLHKARRRLRALLEASKPQASPYRVLHSVPA
jgi:RNA polymerase sigma-70 factor (ECF subfamily)